jgi:Fusaric acid resistance protein-like
MNRFDAAIASNLRAFACRIRPFVGEVTALSNRPLPFARTLRNGATIATGFAGLALTGHLAAAVVCAIFINQLTFVDQMAPLRERLWVLGVAALCYAAAGAVGGLIADMPPVVMLATFAFASFAGLVHGSMPGIELIPRNSLICMVVGAYAPQLGGEAALGAACGAILTILGAYCEHRLAPSSTGLSLAGARESVSYQDSRFGMLYGAAAVGGLALGYFIGDIKPYWVTITTLVVMQPGRYANTLRVAQRFLGTISGVILAYLFALATAGPEQRKFLAGFAVVAPFLWPMALARNYALGVAALSFWVLVLLDLVLFPEDSGMALFMSRLTDTAIGCVLALAANFLIEEQEKLGAPPADASGNSDN